MTRNVIYVDKYFTTMYEDHDGLTVFRKFMGKISNMYFVESSIPIIKSGFYAYRFTDYD